MSWSNTPFPAYEDVVALYTEDASPTTTAPIKFQWAARAPTHMHTGAGSVTFRLVNMRTGVRAAFIRNGLQAPLLVAHSPIVTNTNPHAPTGVHLALTGTPGEMLVQWTASNASQTPYVAWGVVSGQYDNHVGDGSVVTYTREELCGGYATSVGWMHPGLLQRVLLTGLPADATVYYIVGDAVRDDGCADPQCVLRGLFSYTSTVHTCVVPYCTNVSPQQQQQHPTHTAIGHHES